MIVPDANLLLYAYDSSSPFHDRARAWWETCLSGTELVGLVHPVIFAFVRIGMSPRAFERPLTLAQASQHVTAWLDRSVTRVLRPQLDHVTKTLELLREAGAAGPNLVTDAQVAAIAMAHTATVHTADRDFIRFRDLQCVFPLDT
ncbi:MAG: TA system VapC family ribonuclease toxin [Planctomycetia bacterium]